MSLAETSTEQNLSDAQATFASERQSEMSLPVIIVIDGKWAEIGLAATVDQALALAEPQFQPGAVINATSTAGSRYENHSLANKFVIALDQLVMTTNLQGTAEDWFITQNLTDRWGELNDAPFGNKPLAELDESLPLLAHLQQQMWDEATFVVRKDGKFGILYEVEYCSIESETDIYKTSSEPLPSELKPHAEVVATLLKGLNALAPTYPGVEFCIPDSWHIVEERPAVWAFVPDSHLNKEQREALGFALLRL